MCGWVIDWGDAPTWIAAVGTVAALAWAVFLYRGSLQDKRIAQARLLSVVGGASPVQALAGTPVRLEAVLQGVGVATANSASTGTSSLVLTEEAFYSRIHLVSSSAETFSDITVTLLLEDGTEVAFPLGVQEMAPFATWERYAYFRPDTIYGYMRVRVRFRDAGGHSWERINGEPVRAHS